MKRRVRFGSSYLTQPDPSLSRFFHSSATRPRFIILQPVTSVISRFETATTGLNTGFSLARPFVCLLMLIEAN